VLKIDLWKDVGDLRRLLDEAVRRYVALHQAAESAASRRKVTRLDLVFSLGNGKSSPWVHLHLDTRPGAKPDGPPTHPDFAVLLRENWLPAVDAVCHDREVVIQQNDDESRTCDKAALTEAIGGFLVAMLLNARDDGVFADLPRVERCEMGVKEATTGGFEWPRYEFW
jgi:hypothetical protein